MTIRNVDNKVTVTEDLAQPKSENIVKSETTSAAVEKQADTKEQSQRLAGQYLRSRQSFGSTQVQQQLRDSFSLPIPLPLPRIPSPAGMVDFTKLVTVLSSAILDGLKNFGLEGIKFGIAIAEALGNGVKSMKEGIDGFGDLAKGNLGQLKSAV